MAGSIQRPTRKEKKASHRRSGIGPTEAPGRHGAPALTGTVLTFSTVRTLCTVRTVCTEQYESLWEG